MKDPRAAHELGLLTRAAGAHLRRRRDWGQSRTAQAPCASPAPHKGETRSPTPLAGTSAVAAACSDLDSLRSAVAVCRACALCESRTQTVFSDGTGSARVMFIGEAPGRNEDEQGVPFVGRAGALLGDIIEKGMKLRREEVYIANVLKCRPPDNRDPEAGEKQHCTPFLDRQIQLLDPSVLIPLGLHASQHILKSSSSMGRLRGRVHTLGGRKVVPTYHPAYLLRSPGMKKECWKDIQLAMGELGLL